MALQLYRFICVGLLMITALVALPAQAQDSIPEMPDPISNLAKDGAQIRYLGREYGFDAWVTVKAGQEQYFYVPPGGDGFVMGLLFDNDGRVVTVDQVRRLREKGDSLLDSLADMDEFRPNQENKDSRFAFKTPAERLYYDMEQSNWVPIGYANAPFLYMVMDPQCPHCKALITDLREGGYLDRGKIQLRMMPVGFSSKSKAQAAYFMAAPNPEELLMRHLDGDETALPVNDEINQQGVDHNNSIMQSWKFDVTPMLIYRDKKNQVKIVRGRPRDLETMIEDLHPNN